MTGSAAVRRLELVPAALVGTVALLMLVVAVDAVRFHLPGLVGGRPAPVDAHTAGLLVLLAVELLVVGRTGASLARQCARQRRLRRLPVHGRLRIGGHDVAVVGGSAPRAFCVGLWRPRVCVSATAVECLASDELRAVVEHESGHARRRDPLRLLVAQVAADGLGFLAPVHRLTLRQAAAADLAADAAAVSALGSPQPLAAAMVRLRAPAPERVDHLLGRPLRVPGRALSLAALAALAALGALAATLAVLPRDPTLPPLALLALSLPALLALRAGATPAAATGGARAPRRTRV